MHVFIPFYSSETNPKMFKGLMSFSFWFKTGWTHLGLYSCFRKKPIWEWKAKFASGFTEPRYSLVSTVNKGRLSVSFRPMHQGPSFCCLTWCSSINGTAKTVLVWLVLLCGVSGENVAPHLVIQHMRDQRCLMDSSFSLAFSVGGYLNWWGF